MRFFLQYQNYIFITLGSAMFFLFGKIDSIRGTFEQIFIPVQSFFQFIAKAHTEADGNGGKPSYSRAIGTVVVLNILRLALLEKVIPEQLMTMFWVLIGYQLISKVLKDNPALMELIKSKYGVKEEMKQ
jgi:hypothetical protein